MLKKRYGGESESRPGKLFGFSNDILSTFSFSERSLINQRIISLTALFVVAWLLPGCSSIGKGVTKAIMEKAEEKPTPEDSLCEITGPEFSGVEAGHDVESSSPKPRA